MRVVEYERWQKEIALPAALASEGVRCIKMGEFEMEYEIAYLPTKDWALRFSLKMPDIEVPEASCDYRSKRWHLHPTREKCLSVLREQACCFFGQSFQSIHHQQRQSRECMRACMLYCLRDLPLGFPEPKPVPVVREVKQE